MKYFPAPNAVVSNVVNYVAPDPVIRQKYYSFVTRVDHTINENNKLNATFYKSVLNQQYPDMGFPQGIGPTNEGEAVYRNNAGGGLDYVRIFPNDWVLNARIGVLYHPFGVILPGLNFDLASLGINPAGLGYQSFPGLTFSDNYLGLQGATPLVPNTSQVTSQISHDTNASAAAIVSKVIGSHSLRFGFEGLLERYNAANPLSGLGTFNFSRQFTQKNSVDTIVGGDASSGNPIASLLLGYPTSGNYSAQVSYAIQQPYAALFIQDNWKARRNLTLNLGLRWDYQAPYTERNNQLNTGFCTTCVNPLQNSVPGLNLLGGLEFISSGSRHYYPSELHDWQPRFGISYAITPRVVFHGGVGLTYINSMESPFGQGFSATTNYIATNDNTTPLTSIANPFPTGTVPPSGSSLGLATLVGQPLSFIAPGYVRPSLLQWSASLQTRLPGNIVLQPAYVANRVYHWEISKDINALPAQYNLGTPDNVK
ncbi:MAG: TonB-dependent receptor, partial [Blastocatellia bacterium]|nr:TonB-dependent receptor [Blastocatellia bacterium]